MFLLEKCAPYRVVENIESMSLEMIYMYDYEFVIHNMCEWTLNSSIGYLAYIDAFSIAFQCYDIITK